MDHDGSQPRPDSADLLKHCDWETSGTERPTVTGTIGEFDQISSDRSARVVVLLLLLSQVPSFRPEENRIAD